MKNIFNFTLLFYLLRFALYTLSMAGEIGHVVYAARMLTYLGKRVKDPTYWIGTLFPDIRHLGIVSRHRTHPDNVSLSTLVGKNDFHTGMRVHSWIDATREHFLHDQHMKEYLPWHPFVPHALKLVEDEMLYSHFDDWDLIHRLLNKVDPEELYYVESPTPLQKWHTILQHYFRSAPSDASRLELSQAIGLSETSGQELNNVVTLLQQDTRTHSLLEGFLQHLEQLLR